MNSTAIFLPMLATMTLTAVVWFYMYALRIPAMHRAGRHVQTYTTPDKTVQILPDEVNYSASNFRNLCELPILFYGLCLYVFVSGNTDMVYVAAAWVFFAFRLPHSLNHCTRNRVMLRFYTYALAALALWLMLGRAVAGELAVYWQ